MKVWLRNQLLKTHLFQTWQGGHCHSCFIGLPAAPGTSEDFPICPRNTQSWGLLGVVGGECPVWRFSVPIAMLSLPNPMEFFCLYFTISPSCVTLVTPACRNTSSSALMALLWPRCSPLDSPFSFLQVLLWQPLQMFRTVSSTLQITLCPWMFPPHLWFPLSPPHHLQPHFCILVALLSSKSAPLCLKAPQNSQTQRTPSWTYHLSFSPHYPALPSLFSSFIFWTLSEWVHIVQMSVPHVNAHHGILQMKPLIIRWAKRYTLWMSVSFFPTHPSACLMRPWKQWL